MHMIFIQQDKRGLNLNLSQLYYPKVYLLMTSFFVAASLFYVLLLLLFVFLVRVIYLFKQRFITFPELNYLLFSVLLIGLIKKTYVPCEMHDYRVILTSTTLTFI